MKMKKKIMIDLDVVTVAYWDRSRMGDLARSFIKKLSKKDHYIITPLMLIELVRKWKHEKLRTQIERFYFDNSNEILDNLQIVDGVLSNGADFEEVFSVLSNLEIKEEDITLVLASSIKEALLVTFNRIHLKNKEEEINGILSRYGLKTIKITSPE